MLLSRFDKNVLHRSLFDVQASFETRKENMSRNFVSIEYAASYFGVSQRTIRNWISEGRVHGYELGPRLIRLDYDEIENLPVRIHGQFRRGRNGR
jgi:excisionase family DNA binding protein